MLTSDWCGFYMIEFGKKRKASDTKMPALLDSEKVNSLELLVDVANPVPTGATIEVAELYLDGLNRQ